MTHSAVLKLAWIDELNQLISFEAIPGCQPYTAQESDFWVRILELMRIGYRVQ